MNPHATQLLDGANKARLAGDDLAADILMHLLEREMARVVANHEQLELAS